MSYVPPVFTPFDPDLAARLRAAIDGKAKPPGSLGRLEALVVQIGLIEIDRPLSGASMMLPLPA